MRWSVLNACAINADLIIVADDMGMARLTELMEHQGSAIADRGRLLKTIKRLTQGEAMFVNKNRNLSSLSAALGFVWFFGVLQS